LRNAKYTNKFFKLLTAAPHSDHNHTAYQLLTPEEYEAVRLNAIVYFRFGEFIVSLLSMCCLFCFPMSFIIGFHKPWPELALLSSHKEVNNLRELVDMYHIVCLVCFIKQWRFLLKA
jgi:hypothetical protein